MRKAVIPKEDGCFKGGNGLMTELIWKLEGNQRTEQDS